jgi:hypothetical protein
MTNEKPTQGAQNIFRSPVLVGIREIGTKTNPNRTQPSSLHIVSTEVSLILDRLDNQVTTEHTLISIVIIHHSSWPRNRDRSSARKGRPWEMDRRKEMAITSTPTFFPRIIRSRTPPSLVLPSLTTTLQVRLIMCT